MMVIINMIYWYSSSDTDGVPARKRCLIISRFPPLKVTTRPTASSQPVFSAPPEGDAEQQSGCVEISAGSRNDCWRWFFGSGSGSGSASGWVPLTVSQRQSALRVMRATLWMGEIPSPWQQPAPAVIGCQTRGGRGQSNPSICRQSVENKVMERRSRPKWRIIRWLERLEHYDIIRGMNDRRMNDRRMNDRWMDGSMSLKPSVFLETPWTIKNDKEPPPEPPRNHHQNYLEPPAAGRWALRTSRTMWNPVEPAGSSVTGTWSRCRCSALTGLIWSTRS